MGPLYVRGVEVRSPQGRKILGYSCSGDGKNTDMDTREPRNAQKFPPPPWRTENPMVNGYETTVVT